MNASCINITILRFFIKNKININAWIYHELKRQCIVSKLCWISRRNFGVTNQGYSRVKKPCRCQIGQISKAFEIWCLRNHPRKGCPRTSIRWGLWSRGNAPPRVFWSFSKPLEKNTSQWLEKIFKNAVRGRGFLLCLCCCVRWEIDFTGCWAFLCVFFAPLIFSLTL